VVVPDRLDGEDVVVVPLLVPDRPTTVDGVPEDVRVLGESRPPLHHHQPVPDERWPYGPLPVPDDVLEPQRSGCHRPVPGSWRQTEALPWRSWQASTVG
jgi:hypothetical protein